MQQSLVDYGNNQGIYQFNQAPQNNWQNFGSVMGGVGAGMEGVTGLINYFQGRDLMDESVQTMRDNRTIANDEATYRKKFRTNAANMF